jgi:hypothetical protein
LQLEHSWGAGALDAAALDAAALDAAALDAAALDAAALEDAGVFAQDLHKVRDSSFTVLQ